MRNGWANHTHPSQDRAHLVLIAHASMILLWKPLPAYENPVRAWAVRFGGAAENVMVTAKMTITNAFGCRHMALQR
jgi:hypothetical protein